jgi:CMP-2-keto-3-deoxyoctulosonic acid synthetase
LTFGKGIVGFGHGQSSRQTISLVILPQNDADPALYFSRADRPFERKDKNRGVNAPRQALR